MATVTEMRSWLRDNGHEVTARGRLSDDLIEAYETAHADPDGAPGGDDWPDDADLDSAGPDDTVDVPEETRPSRRRARSVSSGKTGGSLLAGLLGGGKKDAKGKTASRKKPPRVSLEGFVSRSYSMLGRVLAPVSPAASACVSVQAPMAGVILNDVVKDTIADKFLQPVARMEEKANAVFALVVPPAAALGIEMSFMGEQTPQVIFRRTVLVQMMREGLRTGLEVSEKYADQIAAAAERNARYDAEVDRLMGLIFPPPPQAETVPEDEPEMAGAA